LTILLDTHVWIWWLTGDTRLSASEHAAINALAEQGAPSISAISMWETQMLHAKGRLTLEMPFESWLLQATAPGVSTLIPIDPAVILEVDRLAQTFHGDPADRIIVATARAFDLQLVTHDDRIRRSRLARIWKPKHRRPSR
jgi:PIN domain nuclease of toxin-antitoxin system